MKKYRVRLFLSILLFRFRRRDGVTGVKEINHTFQFYCLDSG